MVDKAMTKSNVNPLRKTALVKGAKASGNKWSPARHPMDKLEKQAPRKAMTHSLRKGTAKSAKAK
jgi:hypothetical protein